MKLNTKLRKVLGTTIISTMALSSVSTMAADYDKHWAKEAIIEWNDYGIVAGYGEGVFKPNNQVKRAELAAFIARVFGLESVEGATQFTDVTSKAWYSEDVAKVSAAGIMNGAAGKFNPTGFATREEVAVTLVNAFRLTGKGELTFKDEDKIANWAREAVTALAVNGYAAGNEKKEFSPKANITRAEVVQLLDNIVAQLLHESGTYTQDVKGNVVVNTTDVTLEGVEVTESLYLGQGVGIGEGEVIISKSNIAGNMFVSGGGVESIYLKDVTLGQEIVVDVIAPVRIVTEGSSKPKVRIETNQKVILTGDFEQVTVPAGAVVEFKEATVAQVVIEAAKESEVAKVTLDEKTKVVEMIADAKLRIKGTGKVDKLVANVEGILSSIRPTTVVGPKEDKVEYDLPGSSGGSGGSGGSSGSGGSGGGGGGSTDTPGGDSNTPGGDSNKPGGDSNKPGGDIEKPEEVPPVESIAINAIKVNDQDITSSILIEDNHISVDVNELIKVVPSSVTHGSISFENLKENDEVKVEVVLEDSTSDKGNKSYTHKVGKNGELAYTVRQLADFAESKKELVLSKLTPAQKQKVEKYLGEFGLSLDGEYLKDGEIDTKVVLSKYQQALTKLNHLTPEEQEDVALLIGTLADYGIKVDLKARQIEGTVFVTAGSLPRTPYTFKVTF